MDYFDPQPEPKGEDGLLLRQKAVDKKRWRVRWWNDDSCESHEDETEYSLRKDERYLGLIKSPESDETAGDCTFDGLLKIWHKDLPNLPADILEELENENLGDPILLSAPTHETLQHRYYNIWSIDFV